MFYVSISLSLFVSFELCLDNESRIWRPCPLTRFIRRKSPKNPACSGGADGAVFCSQAGGPFIECDRPKRETMTILHRRSEVALFPQPLQKWGTNTPEMGTTSGLLRSFTPWKFSCSFSPQALQELATGPQSSENCNRTELSFLLALRLLGCH